MVSKSVLPVSGGQTGLDSASRIRLRRHKPPSANPESLDRWKSSAIRCGTPAQFRKLLSTLKIFLPFRHLVCLWGYHSRHSIRFVFNHGFPEELLRWYLAKGMVWKGPMFRKWLRTNRPQVSGDVYRQPGKHIDAELLQQARKFNVSSLLAGGIKSRRLWIFCVMSMNSDERCRAYLKRFELVVPILAKALQRACPRPLLTRREIAILEHRTMGKIAKEIAQVEGISEGTVREHLQRIKSKLFTNDLVNAVAIAIRSGMLVHTRREME